MIAISYVMKRKINKIFLEVISNPNIFYTKILLNEIANDQDFLKLTGRLDNIENGIKILWCIHKISKHVFK